MVKGKGNKKNVFVAVFFLRKGCNSQVCHSVSVGIFADGVLWIYLWHVLWILQMGEARTKQNQDSYDDWEIPLLSLPLLNERWLNPKWDQFGRENCHWDRRWCFGWFLNMFEKEPMFLRPAESWSDELAFMSLQNDRSWTWQIHTTPPSLLEWQFLPRDFV